jgi:hypothetical protein
MLKTAPTHTLMTNRDAKNDKANPRFGGIPLGFEAGDANLYRYVKNAPTNATDPSGCSEDLINDVLNNRRPWSDLNRVTQQQLEDAIAQYQSVIRNPPVRSPYPAQLYQEFNQARIAYLRTGVGSGPGSIYEFAERWLTRQSAEWIANNSATVTRLTESIARARALDAQRALQMRGALGVTARSSTRLTVGEAMARFGRVIAGPYVLAITELLLDPTPTAGTANLPVNTLMRPPASPDVYRLPRGTLILPNGLIYIPGPGSMFVPPPDAVVVTGSVVGNTLQPGQTFPPRAVAPISSLPWIMYLPPGVSETEARAGYSQYIQSGNYLGGDRNSRTQTMNFGEWLRYTYRDHPSWR